LPVDIYKNIMVQYITLTKFIDLCYNTFIFFKLALSNYRVWH